MLTLGLVILAIVFGVGALAYFASYFLLSGGKSEEQIRNKYQGSAESQSVFIKKYAEADLSKLRSFLLAAGSVIAFSTSIYALSWSDKPAQYEDLVMETVDDELAIEAPQTEQLKTPPPPPPPPVVEVVEDDEILDDAPKFQDTEIDNDEEVAMDNTPVELEKEEKVVEPEIFTIVEDMPRFKGCETVSANDVTNCTNAEIMKFISKNIVYPPMALENDIEGKVFVRFVVNEKGEVTDVTVAKSADKLLDNAAVALVKTMPKFTPGKQRGKAVRVQYIIPINFKIG